MSKSFVFLKSEASAFEAPHRVDFDFWLIREKDACSGLYPYPIIPIGAKTLAALWNKSGGSSEDLIYQGRTNYEIRFYLKKGVRPEATQSQEFLHLLEKRVARIVESVQYVERCRRTHERRAAHIRTRQEKRKVQFTKDLGNPNSQLRKWAACLQPEMAERWTNFLKTPDPWENGLYNLIILVGANELVRNCTSAAEVDNFRRTPSHKLDHGSDWMSKEIYGVLSGSSNQMNGACSIAKEILDQRSPRAA